MTSAAHGTAGPDGIHFGPNGSGKLYLSMFAHRGGTSRKSQWLTAVPPPSEYGVFCHADESEWCDSAQNYWGVLDDRASPLGTRGERIAKFPCSKVPAAPWHGYPVSPGSGSPGDAPEDDLVEEWMSTGSVTKAVGRKIQRRRI
jgi:hypothetical protein